MKKDTQNYLNLIKIAWRKIISSISFFLTSLYHIQVFFESFQRTYVLSGISYLRIFPFKYFSD